MSEIKRYESGVYYCSGDAMVQSTEGNYVSYEDYAALKAECESNLKSAQYSAETNRKISRKNGEMHDEILSLKAERDALAAENAALKGLVEERCWVYDYDVEGYRDAHDYLPDTPTTDAYANQLRAEGVEMFAKHFNCADISDDILEFAANLRKENGNG